MVGTEAHLWMFYRGTAAACIISLADGRFIDANESFCRLSGYSREEIVGRTERELNVLADPWDRSRILDLLNRHGEIKESPNGLITRDGEVRECYGPAKLIDVDGLPCVLLIFQKII